MPNFCTRRENAFTRLMKIGGHKAPFRANGQTNRDVAGQEKTDMA